MNNKLKNILRLLYGEYADTQTYIILTFAYVVFAAFLIVSYLRISIIIEHIRINKQMLLLLQEIK